MSGHKQRGGGGVPCKSLQRPTRTHPAFFLMSFEYAPKRGNCLQTGCEIFVFRLLGLERFKRETLLTSIVSAS